MSSIRSRTRWRSRCSSSRKRRGARCEVLAEQIERTGCSVTFPRPPHGTPKRGVMIVSRRATSPLRLPLDYLPHRVTAVTVETATGPMEAVGGVCAVPRPDGSDVPGGTGRRAPHRGGGHGLALGDFNILRPKHVPKYRMFQDWSARFIPGSPGPATGRPFPGSGRPGRLLGGAQRRRTPLGPRPRLRTPRWVPGRLPVRRTGSPTTLPTGRLGAQRRGAAGRDRPGRPADRRQRCSTPLQNPPEEDGVKVDTWD